MYNTYQGGAWCDPVNYGEKNAKFLLRKKIGGLQR